jgi:riboflavin biosynthesis pyrimidine reductase
VLCEGGPTLNSSLFSEGLVDELFLTVSNKLVGGADALSIVAGLPLPDPAELELRRVLESDGQLFLRLRVAR